MLGTLSRVVAPLLPLVGEEVHTGIGGTESVHLAEWPDPAELPADDALVAEMDRVREVASVALSLREERGPRTRLPLGRLTVAGAEVDRLRPYAELIATEVNVKEVTFGEDLSAYGTFVLRPNGKVLGPRPGGDTQKVMAAARAGEWSQAADGIVTVAGHTLSEGDFELALQPTGGDGGDDAATAALRATDAVVSLDVEVTPALAAEGTARDLVRVAQQARRDAGLEVTDRIALRLQLPPPVAEAVRVHERHLADQVLATSVDYADEPLDRTATLAGEPVTFAVAASR